MTATSAGAADQHRGRASSPARSRIRRLPCPVSAPPFDDQLDHPVSEAPPAPYLQGTLALTFTLPSGLPAEPDPPAGLRIVGEPASDPADRGMDDQLVERAFDERQPTSSRNLPEPRRWAARLAQAIIETLHGQRPIQQLLRWTDDAVYKSIADRLASRPRDGATTQPTIRSIRVCTPTDGVAEVSVVVESGPRCRALALRIEGLDGQWRCTALDLI